jgi:hypothetical protein
MTIQIRPLALTAHLLQAQRRLFHDGAPAPLRVIPGRLIYPVQDSLAEVDATCTLLHALLVGLQWEDW